MKYSLLLIVLFLILTKISLGDDVVNSYPLPPDQSNICSVASDCTAVIGCCEKWLAVNKEYFKNKEYLKDGSKAYLAHNCWHSFCGGYVAGHPSDGNFQPVTACIDKACTLTNKTMNVNRDEWLEKYKAGS